MTARSHEGPDDASTETPAASGGPGSEVQALDKYACAACGAHAEWNPTKQAVVCPYCGTEAPGDVDERAGTIREIDLVATLRNIPDALRGWQAEKRSVRCQSCNAVSVFDPERVGQNCQFCGSPELVDYDEIKAPLRPQSLLPFRRDEGEVREAVRRWFGSKWLAPGSLKKRALIDTMQGVYLPYWTFDAHTVCPWRADSGTYYYTTRVVTNAKGQRRTEQVRHTRWRPCSGEVRHFFDDEPVPGTRGVRHDLLKRIEPFPTQELVPYDTSYLSGFVVEHYQVVLIEAAKKARESMEDQLRRLCARQIPGDTHRNLRIDPRYSGETFKHILVPVWLLSYDHHGKAYQLVANGHTGEIAGDYPKSPWKLIGIGVAILIIVAAIVFLSR